jgi:hypothetical protein
MQGDAPRSRRRHQARRPLHVREVTQAGVGAFGSPPLVVRFTAAWGATSQPREVARTQCKEVTLPASGGHRHRPCRPSGAAFTARSDRLPSAHVDTRSPDNELRRTRSGGRSRYGNRDPR